MFLRILLLLAIVAEAHGFAFLFMQRGRRRRRMRRHAEEPPKSVPEQSVDAMGNIASPPPYNETNYLDPF
jgi:hypothetical protein